MAFVTNRKTRLGIRLKKSVPIYFLLLPGVALLVLFHYVPIYGIVIAFKDFSPFKGVMGSPWVGLKYFSYFLQQPTFWKVMRNTVVINLYQLVFGFPVPIIFALLLNEVWSNPLKKITQTISYLPYFISWVVVASLFTTILSPSTGIVNGFLEKVFGIEPIYFLGKAQYFRSIIVISGIWKGFGFSSVYYIASLASIDSNLYEAAAIDGAGRLRQIWHISLPGLRNIIIVLLVLQVGSMISIGFEQLYLLGNPIVYEVGDVISTYVYRLGIENTQFSLTAAIGLTQSLVNFVLVFSTNRLARKVAGWSLW
ncbi:putative multiple-sugar transport system permease YteP [Spirochaetia bacterium]|nr:putative multiple-sugar transport system permease YteP [Spirochaetia bacterium]